MQIYINNQFTYLLASAILGIIAGIISNILNFILLFFKSKKKLQFFIDIIFCLIYSCMFFINSYSFNFGSYRWYSAAFAFSALYIFNSTIGVLLVKTEKIFANYLKSVYRNLIKVLDFLLKFVKIIIVNYRIRRYKNKLEYDLLYLVNQERKKHERACCKSKKAKA